jgi:hypothetical protein
MVGADLDVVVLAGAGAAENLSPEVWHTAHAAPYSEKLLLIK